jgi:uncharacterized delta-60 repeat protein
MRKVIGPTVIASALVLLQSASVFAGSMSGSLDRTFAGNGIAYLPQTAVAVAIQADGKIVVVGEDSTPAGRGVFAVTRYNPDGTLDPSFSGDGHVRTTFAGSARSGAVAVQADGRIVVGGTTETKKNNAALAFARYLPDGSLDTSFSRNGTLVARKVGASYVYEISDIALGSDGAIVASATAADRHRYLFGVIRLTPRGVLDPTFSDDGLAVTRFNRHNAFAGSVAVQPDGAIVAVGSARARGRFAVSRFLPDGTHDLTFSDDGKRTIGFGGRGSGAADVALQNDGKIVIAGTVRQGRRFAYGHLSIVVARCNTDGSLDPSFAGDGTRWTSAKGNLSASALAIQSDGKIVVGGQSTPTVAEYPDDFVLVRYTTAGTLDPTFADHGIRVQSFRLDDWIEDLALQADGKIVVVGASQGGPPRGWAVARYRS